MTRRHKRTRISKRMNLQRKRKITFLFFFVLICSVSAFGASYFALKKYVNQVEEQMICNNIYIGSVNVSGMTYGKAKQAMEAQLLKEKSCIITMKTKQGEEKAVLEELGISVKNTEEQIKKAVNYGKSGSVWRRYHQMKKLEKKSLVLKEKIQLNKETATALITERVLPLEKGATDATIKKTEKGFSITEEKQGKVIDVEKSLEKITTYLNEKWKVKNFAVTMLTKVDTPYVTKKELSVIKDELASFSTDAGGGGRWKNLERGVELLNGRILMPEESLSVYQCAGPYEEANGYVLGGSYEDGQVVEAYGGGICQVTSTLYNAVILAELDIVERYPHSMLVGYVKPSMDAAVAGDYMDFVFKNQYDTPVYVSAQIDDINQMKFTIYGKETRDEQRTIAYESETISTQEYKTVYREDPEAYIGSVQNTGSPYGGQEARLWKVVYEKGVEVSRDIFNTSVYEPANAIVKVGTASDNPDATAMVQTAIASQDKTAINEAIGKASAM